MTLDGAEATAASEPVTPAFLSGLLSGNTFPNNPPNPPASEINDLNSSWINNACNVTQPANGLSIESLVNRSRIWLKAPSSNTAQTFKFLKVVRNNRNQGGSNISDIISINPAMLVIPANGQYSNPEDFTYAPAAAPGYRVDSSESLLSIEFKTYPTEEGGADKAHKINLATKQQEKDFYGEGWEKCVSKVWNTNTVNLIDYLKGGPGNHVSYDGVVKWVVNGSAQDSPEISLGNEPSDDSHRHYFIQVLAKNGNDTFDRLIITVVPRSTKSKFDSWYAAEKVDKSWLEELPNLFDSLITTPGTDGYLPRPDRNFNPYLYGVPHEISTRMHPNGYFEARSYATSGGHGHQMCFSASGDLLKNGVSAGSADKSAPFPANLNPTAHVNTDVKPFVWALQLDGTPADQDVTTLSAPIMHEGAYLKKYSECRPALANSKPILSDGATP